MRTALLSFHSHRDRSFLDDRDLALLSGDLEAQGHDNDLVVAVLDPSALDFDGPAAADRAPPRELEALAAAIEGYDVIFYERVWSRRVPEALRRLLPRATFVHGVGEHRLVDPPCDYVCDGDLRTTFPALLSHLRGEGPLPSGTAAITGTDVRRGLGPRPRPTAPTFRPNLHPIVIPEGSLPADRTFSLVGNRGCPYQADARRNPLYEGVAIPDGVGRGCAFCTTGNRYEARPQGETAESLVTQIRWVRETAPERTRLVLKDQNPFAYLPRVLEAVRDEGLGGFSLLLETRADWFLAAEDKLTAALDVAAAAEVKIAPFLVGVENFSADELARYNKGVSPADNERFLERLRAWDRAHDAFDLGEASFGFVLLSPWTTLRDLRVNYEALVRTRFDELRGHVLRSRARLYPDTALYWLAKRDGLLEERYESAGADAAARYGYYPAHPFRFVDPLVARFAAAADGALARSGGADEMAIFGALLDALEGEAARPRDESEQGPQLSRDDHAAIDAKTVLARVAAATACTAITAAVDATATTAARHDATGSSRSGSAAVSVYLGGQCGLTCAPCDCRQAPSDGALAVIRRGGRRLELRGGSRDGLDPRPLAAAARAAGFSEVVHRTHAIALRNPGAARVVAEAGIDTLLVPIFSADAEVHDRIAGRPGAHRGSLRGLTEGAAAGLAIEVEVPLLSANVDGLIALLEVVSRAAPELRSVRFMISRSLTSARLAPPPLAMLDGRLAAALRWCAARGIETPLPGTSGVPFCTLESHPAEQRSLRSRGRRRRRVTGAEHVPGCTGCAAENLCPGLPAGFIAAHGEDGVGVRPLARLPAHVGRDGRPTRVWTPEERQAARSTPILVLRPTVHCNQDCGFCSANETTKNVWPDPDAMVRQIARAAARGVRRVSFSGGEPTLSRHLPTYVHVARRAGVPEIELVTNGVLLAREAKVRALSVAGLTHAFVSLHASDEALSRAMTLKRGDFERTVRAIDHLVAAGVRTAVNHVINAQNHRMLPEFVRFVHGRWGSEVMISFAFVTPQFRALDNFALVPEMAAVRPLLRLALYEAQRLGVAVVVGSRQGLPPCQLGEFEGWSDIFEMASPAASEDRLQKTQGPGCAECRYRNLCTGVWKAYAARFGLDELQPIEGAAFTDAEVRANLNHAQRSSWGQPSSFADVPPALRRPALEANPVDVSAMATTSSSALAPSPSRRIALPVVGAARPLRVAVAGTGGRARVMLAAIEQTPDAAVAAVASPHADVAVLPELGHTPRYTDVPAMLDDVRPDFLVVASATRTHLDLAREALRRGVPVLVEKPLAESVEAALSFARSFTRHSAEASAESSTRSPGHEGAADSEPGDLGPLIAVAHNLVGTPGLSPLLREGAGDVHITRRVPADSADAPRTWSASALYEVFVHLLGLLAHAGFDGASELDAVGRGATRPECVRLAVRDAERRGTVTFEVGGVDDVLEVAVGDAIFTRRGRTLFLDRGAGPETIEARGSDVARLVGAFAEAVRDRDRGRGKAAEPGLLVPPEEGAAAMRLAEEAIRALGASGTVMERKTRPKRAASPGLRKGT